MLEILARTMMLATGQEPVDTIPPHERRREERQAEALRRRAERFRREPRFWL